MKGSRFRIVVSPGLMGPVKGQSVEIEIHIKVVWIIPWVVAGDAPDGGYTRGHFQSKDLPDVVEVVDTPVNHNALAKNILRSPH